MSLKFWKRNGWRIKSDAPCKHVELLKQLDILGMGRTLLPQLAKPGSLPFTTEVEKVCLDLIEQQKRLVVGEPITIAKRKQMMSQFKKPKPKNPKPAKKGREKYADDWNEFKRTQAYADFKIPKDWH